MHQEIRHSLEEFLRGNQLSELPAEFQAHLGECLECADELRLLQAQSELLRSLASVEVEPRAGFYARVVERIQTQPASIWSVFLDRKFGFRLAVASAALVALLGTYLITSEQSGPEFLSPPAVVSTDRAVVPTDPAVVPTDKAQGDQDGLRQQRQQRDAVLVDLASYRQ